MFQLLCLVLIGGSYQTLPRMIRGSNLFTCCPMPNSGLHGSLVFPRRMQSLLPPPLPPLPKDLQLKTQELLALKPLPPLPNTPCNSILKKPLPPLIQSNITLPPRKILPPCSLGPFPGRSIALDTESTGLRGKKERTPDETDQLTEIGCVEIIDGRITGLCFRKYINPQQRVTAGAHRITGHTWYFLQQFPTFKTIAPDFLRFLAGARLIIHDAPGDLKLINTALTQCGNPYGPLESKHEIIDTLALARCLEPRKPANLTALCKRYLHGEFDERRDRLKHGALIDAKLLAKVFCKMTATKDGLPLPIDKDQIQPKTDKTMEKEDFFGPCPECEEEDWLDEES
jgi:DNA polymerase III subunit epsilon